MASIHELMVGKFPQELAEAVKETAGGMLAKAKQQSAKVIVDADLSPPCSAETGVPGTKLYGLAHRLKQQDKAHGVYVTA